MATKKPEPKKAGGKGPPVAVGVQSILDAAFPVWNDGAVIEKETAEKYEDVAGLCLPAATTAFLDAWKRPEDVVLNSPNVPMVCLTPGAAPEPAGKGAKNASPMLYTRKLEGELYAGHTSFDWLLATFISVMAVEAAVKKGDYLWELIYPRDPRDGQPIKAKDGKYRIRLFVMDCWRTVVVDDRIPTDLFGRPLLVGVRPLQLWPLLLCKAVLKVMVMYKSLDCALPHQVNAFQMLTGWPQEDLLDPHCGTPLEGGFLFDRLEDHVRATVPTVGGDAATADAATGGGAATAMPAERRAVATCCLVKRSIPERKPPRIIVLCGPSAVGKGPLMAKLVQEYPDKFGLTVSHTTRRPREHEQHELDYSFTDKQQFLTDLEQGLFLESAPVRGIAGSYYYGTSLATVREVAATGKLCVMGLDLQGAASLRGNKRIDGLYLYVGTSGMQVLEERQRRRLREPEATIQRRLTWAEQQMAKAQQPGLFDHIVENGKTEQVYMDVKEAISTLSPIIRNRLRGLPAYVLDYSDLIPPNSVEKPFLKPVLVAGPHTGERRALMEALVREFPDVFAFPVMHTTRQPDEDALYRTDPEATDQQAADAGAEDDGVVVHPSPVALSPADYDAKVAAGEFVAQRSDLFTHPMVAHRHAVTTEAVQQVIASGRLPLLDMEAEAAEQMKSAGVDCLTIFLRPPSITVHKQRLERWLTEDDATIAQRQAAAQLERAAAQSSKVFDQFIVNDNFDVGYEQLKRTISRHRPDILDPLQLDRQAEQARTEAAGSSNPPPLPVLLLCGPTGGGKERLAAHLTERFPTTFAVAAQITDRKARKGEVDTDALQFVRPDVMTKMAEKGLLVEQVPSEGGAVVATSFEAITAVTATGKVCILDVSSQAMVATLLSGQLRGGFAVYVSQHSSAGPYTLPLPPPHESGEVAAELAATQASNVFRVVVTDGDAQDAQGQIQDQLHRHVPWALPAMPPLLIVGGLFGSGKRELLQRLMRELPGTFGVPLVHTTKPRDAATAVLPTAAAGADATAPEQQDMVVISKQQADAWVADGSFLVRQTVLGHTYGIPAAAVRKIQTAGRVCILDIDNVSDAQSLRAAGQPGAYVFMRPACMSDLRERLCADVYSNPPLGYEPQEALEAMLATLSAEAEAAREPGLFDETVDVVTNPQESFGRLAEAVHRQLPAVVTRSFVYGYGRGLWDPTQRAPGNHPLRIMLLGPAASGKSTQAELLAQRFAVPHVNVGDLLYDEVAARTALGLEAKEYMDSSKTVPDRFFAEVLVKRVAQSDCQIHGWVVDGYPHTRQQAEDLAAQGIRPDKVIFLDDQHSRLLERASWRRIDPVTGKVYLLPGAVDAHAGGAAAAAGSAAVLGAPVGAAAAGGGAAAAAPSASTLPAVKPVLQDGSVDEIALARLTVRHDDSEENVLNRLRFWDMHNRGLRAAYEDVSLRVDAAAAVEVIQAAVEEFVTVEARIEALSLVESAALEELQYQVVQALRYRRQQLVKLLQRDGKAFWVALAELARNSYNLLLQQDPASFAAPPQQLRCLDLSAFQPPQLLSVDSPEPVQLLCSFFNGPQHPLQVGDPECNKVLAVCGPSGSGRSCLTDMLVREFPKRVARVSRLTTRPLHKRELDRTVSFLERVTDAELDQLAAAGKLAESTAAAADGTGWRCATTWAALRACWQAGQLPVVEGSLDTVTALRQAQPPVQVVAVYVTASPEALDVRMRLQGIWDETDIQRNLLDAQRQEAALQLGSSSRESGSSTGEPEEGVVVDQVIQNDHVPISYGILKHVASQHWPAQLRQTPGIMVLQEVSSWQDASCSSSSSGSGSSAASLLRISAGMGNSARLELPRGRHLLRICTQDQQLLSVTFYSSTPFLTGDYAKVLPSFSKDAHLTQIEGAHEAITSGSKLLLLRLQLRVNQPCTLACQLQISNIDLRAATWMTITDNSTGSSTSDVLGRFPAKLYTPNDLGYTLVAVAQPCKEVTPGNWQLTVTSSQPIALNASSSAAHHAAAALTELPVSRVAACEGSYVANSSLSLCRYVITASQAVPMALMASVTGDHAFSLRLLDTQHAKEITCTTSYPTLQQWSSTDGAITVPHLQLPAGKYIAAMELDPSRSAHVIEPTTGATQPEPSWQLLLMPAADERICAINIDDSKERYHRGIMDSWGAATGPVAAVKSAAVGKDRPRVATAALERLLAEEPIEPASSSGDGSCSVTIQTSLQRQGKTGPVDMRPAEHYKVLRPSDPQQAELVGKGELEDRASRMQAAALQDSALLAVLSASRDTDKSERMAQQARTASEFTEWRSNQLSKQQRLLDIGKLLEQPELTAASTSVQ